MKVYPGQSGLESRLLSGPTLASIETGAYGTVRWYGTPGGTDPYACCGVPGRPWYVHRCADVPNVLPGYARYMEST